MTENQRDQRFCRRSAANWLCIFPAFLLAYGVAHSALRLIFSRNLPQDDVTSNLYAQTFELGYTEWQPPLYEWLLWCVQRLTGPTLPSFLLIKYVLLAAVLGLLYLAATRLFEDSRWAVLSALSLLLTYQVGWVAHEGVTQTLVLMCAIAGSLWTLMRIAECASSQNYFLFGVFVGLGLLSKYSFLAFVLALSVSCMLQPALRARLLNWKILLSIGTAIVIASPFLWWLRAQDPNLLAFYSWIAPTPDGRIRATLVGLVLSIFSPLAFLFPLDVLLPVCFPRMIPEIIRATQRDLTSIHGRQKPDWEILLFHVTLMGFLILILGAIFTGANRYLEFYMYPLFLLTPLWLMRMAKRGEVRASQANIFTALFFGLIGATLLVRAVHLGLETSPWCDRCRPAIPYDGLAAALKERGFERATVVAADRHLAGNLRRLLPSARIVCLASPAYEPPHHGASGSKAVLVWPLQASEQKVPKAGVEWLTVRGAKLRGSTEHITIEKKFYASSFVRAWDWLIQPARVTQRN